MELLLIIITKLNKTIITYKKKNDNNNKEVVGHRDAKKKTEKRCNYKTAAYGNYNIKWFASAKWLSPTEQS